MDAACRVLAESRAGARELLACVCGLVYLRRMFLKSANLALLFLFPLSWFAPLLRAGFLPLRAPGEITIVSGLQALWEVDVALALLVTFLAIFAPYLKTIGLALIHFGLLRRRVLPALILLGRLAMADVFLIALYVVLFKGVGIGRVEAAWGLWLFTGCVLASLGISHATARRTGAPR